MGCTWSRRWNSDPSLAANQTCEKRGHRRRSAAATPSGCRSVGGSDHASPCPGSVPPRRCPRPPRRVRDHLDPQPEEPQRQLGGQVAGGAPRCAVVDPDPRRHPAATERLPQVASGSRTPAPCSTPEGGKSRSLRTAPVNSSAIRSHDTRVPSARARSSADRLGRSREAASAATS